MKYYFQYIIFIFLRTIIKIFHVFPIKNNRIVIYSFNGKQYSCNPKQITEYLIDKQPQKYEIIWAFKNPEKFIGAIPACVKTVKFRSMKYYYYAKTARIIIMNVQGFGELSRRKGQDIIQTWHASNGYKKQGMYSGIRRKIELLYHRDYSYVLSGSKSMEERRVRGTMNFQGTVLHGTPRMDMIIENDYVKNRQKVWEHFGLKKDEKVVLYAPTWRSNRNICDYGLDYKKVISLFEEKFGGKWRLAVRFHPNVKYETGKQKDCYINATTYHDMQELLCSVDALITDYSSCVWDFSFRYKPCFLYCTDLKEYGSDRDFDIPICQWGVSIAENIDELEKNILNYESNKANELIQIHHLNMGNYEDGRATERVYNLIEALYEGKKYE